MTPDNQKMREYRAYYFTLKATGIPEIDAILEAVATAGKMYHSTAQWNDRPDWDDNEPSPIEKIQAAIDKAGAAWQAAQPVQVDEPWQDCADDYSYDIAKYHPTNTGDHDTYELAHRLVSHRHSKGALVALVNYLLLRTPQQPQPVSEEDINDLADGLDDALATFKFMALNKERWRILARHALNHAAIQKGTGHDES